MSIEPLKVFISWSGPLAHEVAALWRELLVEMFDNVRPWMSSADIESGARGLDAIKDELDSTSFGLVIATPDNQNAPWINFEAGALSRALGNEVIRVAVCLVNFDSPTQLTGPLKQFQGNLLNEEGVVKILTTIAKYLDADWITKERAFSRLWPDYQPRFEAAALHAAVSSGLDARTTEDMLDELVLYSREQRNESAAIRARLTSIYTSLRFKETHGKFSTEISDAISDICNSRGYTVDQIIEYKRAEGKSLFTAKLTRVSEYDIGKEARLELEAEIESTLGIEFEITGPWGDRYPKNEAIDTESNTGQYL